ncbi:MAG: efflux RND transporter periplasmic adaptor subunit [Sandaracinaceae bacterium]
MLRPFIILLTAFTLLAACGDEDTEAIDPPRLVVTEPVAVEDAVDRVRLLGDVHGEQEVRVFAALPERVRILHVEEGDVVEAGDPIVTLDADLQSSSLQQASAAVNAAEVSRDRLDADVSRVRGLVQSGALPRSQLDALEAQLRGARAQLDQVRAARRTAGEQRSRGTVRAPIAGTVAMLTASEGDTVVPQQPICAIVQAATLDVELRVTEQDYVRVRTGMRVRLRPPALPDVEREGVVSRIAPVLDRLTRTALVHVRLDNADGVLRPGMVAEAEIELSRRPEVVLAPSRALVLSSRTRDAREAAVFVFDRDAGVARRLSVTLGQRYDGRVEVTGGLEGGEELVVQGQHLLRDGAAIRTREAAPAAES